MTISIIRGGIAPKPWPVKEAEDLLRGQPVTEALATAALARATPLTRNGYKVDMAKDAIRDAALALV